MSLVHWDELSFLISLAIFEIIASPSRPSSPEVWLICASEGRGGGAPEQKKQRKLRRVEQDRILKRCGRGVVKRLAYLVWNRLAIYTRFLEPIFFHKPIYFCRRNPFFFQFLDLFVFLLIHAVWVVPSRSVFRFNVNFKGIRFSWNHLCGAFSTDGVEYPALFELTMWSLTITAPNVTAFLQ